MSVISRRKTFPGLSINITHGANAALESMIREIATVTGTTVEPSDLILLGTHLIRSGDRLSALEGIATLISREEKRPVSINEVVKMASAEINRLEGK